MAYAREIPLNTEFAEFAKYLLDSLFLNISRYSQENACVGVPFNKITDLKASLKATRPSCVAWCSTNRF